MMSRAKIRITCLALSVSIVLTATLVKAPAESSWKQIIVKCDPEDLARIRTFVSSAIVDARQGYYLLTVPSSVDVRQIEAIRGKAKIEAADNSRVKMPRRPSKPSPTAQTPSSTVPSLGATVDYYGTSVREAYVNQAAAAKINLRRALDLTTGAGTRVAIIDTGIDETHPAFQGILLSGKNYVGQTAVATEFDDPVVAQHQWSRLDQHQWSRLDQHQFSHLDQHQFSHLDQHQFSQLDQHQFSQLDQHQFSQLDENQPTHFGHGTMMAGLVHFVAPHARIIPLKAFDASGTATEWNIVRAIHDAVDLGADVISMSFSNSNKSRMIFNAIEYASEHGVVAVAASGNENTEAPTYPASYDPVVAIGATDTNDQKASFSNFGKYVDLSAPGVDIISTYPGGRWAMSSGTSDAVPLVSGLFALVKQRGGLGSSLRARIENTADSLNLPPQYRDKLGKGRINAYRAVTGGN